MIYRNVLPIKEQALGKLYTEQLFFLTCHFFFLHKDFLLCFFGCM